MANGTEQVQVGTPAEAPVLDVQTATGGTGQALADAMAAFDAVPQSAPTPEQPVEIAAPDLSIPAPVAEPESTPAADLSIPAVSDTEELPAADIEQTATEVTAEPLDIETVPPVVVTPAVPAGTDKLSALAREVGRSSRQDLTAQNTYASTDVKQQKPLRERSEITDHFDVTVQTYDPATQTYTVETGAVGGIANGQSVGRSKQKQQYQITGQNLASVGSALSTYAANVGNLSPAGQIKGTVDLYYNILGNLVTDKDTRAQVLQGAKEYSAFSSAYSLFDNWSRYNDFSRFRATASTLERTARAFGPKNLFADPQGNLTGVGAAANGLGILNFGYSAYNLLENWDQMTSIQRTGAVLNTIGSGVHAYQGAQGLATYLSGASTGTGAAVAGSAGTAGAGATAGATGATAGTTGASAAGGTAAGTSTGAATGASAAEAGGSGAAAGTAGVSYVQYLSYAAAILGVYNIIDQWGTGGADGRANGAANGAAIGSVFGPWGMAIGAAIGVAIGSIKTGKSSEQGKRDFYRDHYTDNKIFELRENSETFKSEHNIQLADGTFYDVSQDGQDARAMYKGEVKTYKNPHLIAERDRDGVAGNNELRPYDIDYTSDLDFSTHLATKGINIFMSGGSIDLSTDSEAAQMNGYLTNAAVSNLDSRDFTEENFTKSMSNVRQFYSKMGINSKAEGIELANALMQSGRMTEKDFNAVMFGLEFAFSSNYEQAKGLLSQMGREGAAEGRSPDTTTMSELKAQQKEEFAPVQATKDLGRDIGALDTIEQQKEAVRNDEELTDKQKTSKLNALDRRQAALQEDIERRIAEREAANRAPGV